MVFARLTKDMMTARNAENERRLFWLWRLLGVLCGALAVVVAVLSILGIGYQLFGDPTSHGPSPGGMGLLLLPNSLIGWWAAQLLWARGSSKR